MIRAGITGGIGSGKSIICRIFKQLGVPVFSADDEGGLLLNSHPEVIGQVKELFGDEIYVEGQLNRPAMAELVFSDSEKLQQLNNIVHPAVKEQFDRWCQQQHNHHYILKEAAILFETGIYKELDCTVLITSPEELRIQRVMQRDGADREQVTRRMKNQWPDADKEQLADYIICNDDTALVIPQVLHIHDELTAR